MLLSFLKYCKLYYFDIDVPLKRREKNYLKHSLTILYILFNHFLFYKHFHKQLIATVGTRPIEVTFIIVDGGTTITAVMAASTMNKVSNMKDILKADVSFIVHFIIVTHATCYIHA